MIEKQLVHHEVTIVKSQYSNILIRKIG